jgi:Clp amino terminal domain, pathogenicity island component
VGLWLGWLRDEKGRSSRPFSSQTSSSLPTATDGQIPFTPRAKKVLELALREALSLGHNYIGTERILLGLVSENEGVAARILVDLDADQEAVRTDCRRSAAISGSLFRPMTHHNHHKQAEPSSTPHARREELFAGRQLGCGRRRALVDSVSGGGWIAGCWVGGRQQNRPGGHRHVGQHSSDSQGA